MALVVHKEGQLDYDMARQHYIQASHAEAQNAARQVNDSLRAIYENVRTLTLLPSVQKIDRHANNLSEEGRATIQQIYNNLVNNVSVSEVYIVPVDFDHGKIDVSTGKPEAPIVMFDQLIMSNRADVKSTLPNSEAVQSSAPAPALPEVEDFEYAQLHDQLSWLKQKVPNFSNIDGLNIPVISGPEVITCDNSLYASTLNDKDRFGVIFSEPFYGPNLKLKGVVSAIILSEAFRKMLPDKNYALVNAADGFVGLPAHFGQESVSAKWVAKGLADPDLIYSESVPLMLPDVNGKWLLWAGKPVADFENSAEAESAINFETSGLMFIGLIVSAGLIFIWLVQRNLNIKAAASAMLEYRVAERTAEIHFMASHDVLTGLPNRAQLTAKLDDAMARVRHGEKLAVLCLDLDHFKAVNDTLGHPVGDQLLKGVAKRLQEACNDLDLVARLGGDEFVILQSDIERPDQAGNLARKIIAALNEPFHLEGQHINIGVCIGIAFAPNDGEQCDLLLRNADMALYRAKKEGRNGCCFFESAMDVQLQRRRALELDLRRAVENDEFVLFYQPQVNAISEKVTGFEALLRWNHPQRGIVSPIEFVSLAEEIGLIGQIGEWVLREACREAATWPGDIKVAVNLSPLQFKSPSLAPMVTSALMRAGLPPARLELEITESVLLADNENTLTTLHQLRALGTKIALDDFGTGYCSLSYLRSFPFDRIKIDKSFVAELASSKDCRAIVRAVSGLGESLGIPTTAEGIETLEQLNLVREHLCTDVQGYYFSRPRPASEIKAMIACKEAEVAA